jgi:predicted ferric reductase
VQVVPYNKNMSAFQSFIVKNRVLLGTLVVLLAMALLAGGWSIPFQFESFSILYKFGKLKVYLRYGKVIGITVALLLLFQVLLASRLKILEQVFSVKILFILHRINGFIITCLVAVHPVLIKASENFIPYTFGKKYYPEFVGIVLIFVLLTVSVAAIFRNFFKMPYVRWRFLHRLGATLILIILPAHVLFVSDTFKSGGLPRSAALTIFSLNFLFITYIWLKRFFKK